LAVGGGRNLFGYVLGYRIPWFFIPQAGSIRCMARPSPKSAGDPSLAAIGAAIKAARRRIGLSQEALAHDAGLDRSYVGGIERGEHNLTVLNLLRIADALDCKGAVILKSAGL
jgi:DNA-binding XRE family transcriptional regulator